MKRRSVVRKSRPAVARRTQKGPRARQLDAPRYAVVIEKADGNYSAYVPDLPGCVATGATPAKTLTQIRQAIRFHLDGMREDGVKPPRPATRLEYVDA